MKNLIINFCTQKKDLFISNQYYNTAADKSQVFFEKRKNKLLQIEGAHQKLHYI